MGALNYRAPADDNGKFLPWVNDLRNKSGSYVIRNAKSGEILYVGESHTCRLADTIKRHFHAWRDEPERKHFTYQKGRVQIAVRTCRKESAVRIQNNLIRRLTPRDNTLGYGEQPEPAKRKEKSILAGGTFFDEGNAPF